MPYLEIKDLLVLRTCNKELRDYIEMPGNDNKHLIQFMKVQDYSPEIIEFFSA